MHLRYALLTFCACYCFYGSAVAQSNEKASDLEAVMVPLNLYLQGHATGDGAYMEQAFHPEAKLFWVTDDALSQVTSEAYIARLNGTPPADEAERRRRIVSIDISGDIAVAKIELDYPGAFLTDYMTLIRVDGAWKIINKAFTRSQPRQR